jgi:hypothetical protein
MLLASIVAATVLAQGCPEPPSRFGPPPCAAANVPGCLPGYHREVDAHGRVRYVCDQVAYQAPPPYEAPPAPPSAPPPVPPGARALPPVAPRYAAPWAPPAPRRGQLGFLLMPGISSTVTHPRDSTSAGAVGIELRPQYGGGRLRFGFEASTFGRVAEVALKYDFFDWSQVRPFLALGVGGASVDPDPAWRLSGSISAGLDLYVSRDFFFSVELKERGFARRSSAVAYGLEPGPLHQTALFLGVGLYL